MEPREWKKRVSTEWHQVLEVEDGLKARKEEDSRSFLQKAKEGTFLRVQRKEVALLTNSLDVQKVHVYSRSSPAHVGRHLCNLHLNALGPGCLLGVISVSQPASCPPKPPSPRQGPWFPPCIGLHSLSLRDLSVLVISAYHMGGFFWGSQTPGLLIFL